MPTIVNVDGGPPSLIEEDVVKDLVHLLYIYK